MNRLAYTRPDGGLSIVVPAPKKTLEKVLGPLTEAEYEAHVKERSIPSDALNVVSIEESDIPIDREFRNAWKLDNNVIDFDLVKAKDLQLKRIRLAREPKFELLDKEFMLALEKNDDVKKQEVMNKKQVLRDITEPLKALVPNSIDDIKNAFPDILKPGAA